jgi:arylsulfatase A
MAIAGSRRSFLKELGLGAAALSMGRRAHAGAKPNIVFIMADDMGYGDPGCYNPDSRISTPNLDLLAKQGMRFTDAHSPAAVCVPTRYGLITGRYPLRMDGEHGASLIRPDRLTLGGLLQKNGYSTACIGKWHLGVGGKNPDYSAPLQDGPIARGFDYYFGIPRSLDQPPYYYIENDRCVEPPTERIGDSNTEGMSKIQGEFWREGGIAPNFRHLDVLPTLTRKAVEYIDRRKSEDSESPFFLYLALPAPHTPWMPYGRFRGVSKAGMYGDYVAQVDDTVGQVMTTLNRAGMTDSTLFMFTSDNGPVWYKTDVEKYGHKSVHMLRGMKGDAWEGGHRMPFIARWPGEIQKNSTSDEIICHTDMMATFAAMLGDKLPQGEGRDSYNIMPALRGERTGRPVRDELVVGSSRKFLAIRQGPWKLIPQLGSGGFSEPRSEDPQPGGPQGQLYNLDDDIGETNNLWMERPDIVERLSTLLAKYKS